MNTTDFCEQFDGLDAQVSQLSEQVGSKRRSVEDLEGRLKTRRLIQQVLAGLKNNTHEQDPGKYCPAFYFVAKITSDEIQRADKPSLQKPCPECRASQYVVMKYEQTFDSPEGDTWEKHAFIMCKDHGVYQIAHFESDNRF